MIEREGVLTIKRQAKLLDLGRSSVYYTPRGTSVRDLVLMRRLDELHLQWPFYGSRKLLWELHQEGHAVGRRHVVTLMRKMGIEAIYRKPRTSIPAREATIYPYLLTGLTISRPNQVWSADITYLPMAHGFLYLSAILDVFSRKVLAWRLSNTMTADFCVEALEEAIARFGAPETFNTDQGSQTGFNWSSQRSLCSDLTFKIFIAVRPDADASEVGSRSTSQDFVHRFGWSSPVERLSRSAVQRGSNRIKLSFPVPAEVCALRKVLSQQTICIFIGTSLPRTSRIAEVDL